MLLGAIAVSLIGGLASRRFYRIPQPLTHLAIASVDTHSWSTAWLCRCYFTLNDNHILFFRDPVRVGGPFRAFVYDFMTGKETACSELHNMMAATDTMRNTFTSPDGIWRICGDQSYCFAANLKGGHLSRFPSHGATFWNGSSKEIIQLTYNTTRHPLVYSDTSNNGTYSKWTYFSSSTYNVQSGKLVESWPLKQDSLLNTPSSDPDRFLITSDKRILTDTMPFRFNLTEDAAYPDHVDIRTQSLTPVPEAVHTDRIHLPADATLRQIVYSSRGDRIAWLFKFHRQSPVLKWLHRFFSSIKAPPVYTTELWVCQRDGSNMHAVGYVPATRSWLPDLNVMNMQWTHDGRYICFLYRDRLWVVPSD